MCTFLYSNLPMKDYVVNKIANRFIDQKKKIASRFMSSFQFHCMYCFVYFTKTLYCSQHQILSHLWQDLMSIKNKQNKNKEETLPDCVVSNDWISSLAYYYILECEIKYSLKCIYL